MDKGKFLKENNGMFQRIVNTYYNKSTRSMVKVNREDVLQEAHRAAIYAIDKFDPNRGEAKLTSYVFKAASNACQRYISNNMYDLNYTHSMQHTDWRNADGDEEAIAAATGLACAIKIDADVGGEGVSVRDIIPASGDKSVLDSMVRAEQIDILKDEVSKLPEKEYDIVMKHLNGETFDAIGLNYGVSRQAAHSIHKKAIGKLHVALRERLGEEIFL